MLSVFDELCGYAIFCVVQAHQTLRVEFETLSENYDKLHQKSQEIIHTLQKERDAKILENEELKTQVCIHAVGSGSGKAV